VPLSLRIGKVPLKASRINKQKLKRRNKIQRNQKRKEK